MMDLLRTLCGRDDVFLLPGNNFAHKKRKSQNLGDIYTSKRGGRRLRKKGRSDHGVIKFAPEK
jgi:hypothetical protein